MDRGGKPSESQDVPPICAAIAEALAVADVPQRVVAEALGVTQQQVSKWIKGSEPKLAEIARIEDALGLGRGALLLRVGAVDCEGLTVADAVLADETLRPEHKRTLRNAYETALIAARQKKPS